MDDPGARIERPRHRDADRSLTVKSGLVGDLGYQPRHARDYRVRPIGRAGRDLTAVA